MNYAYGGEPFWSLMAKIPPTNPGANNPAISGSGRLPIA
jgi:hypothetical protein